MLENIEYVTLATERLMNYKDMLAQSDIGAALAFLVPIPAILTTTISLIVHKPRNQNKKFHLTVSLCYILSVVLGVGMLFNSLSSYINLAHASNNRITANAENVKANATLTVGKKYDSYYFIEDMDNLYSTVNMKFSSELADQDWCTCSDDMKTFIVTKEVTDAEVTLYFYGGFEHYDTTATISVSARN